jgi:ADP-heptose:LPS heptosyltransferase
MHFVNLQYGDTQEEVNRLAHKHGLKLLQCNSVDNHANLDGLAALIRACDLVVTTSNSTAHLAGGVGVPTELIVPPLGRRLWYWCHSHNQRSLWYPSITIHEAGEPVKMGTAQIVLPPSLVTAVVTSPSRAG